MSVKRMSGHQDSERRGRRILAHIEIRPVLGGGHSVTHVFSGFGKEPREYKFGPNENLRALNHIARYSGINMPGLREPSQVGEGNQDQP